MWEYIPCGKLLHLPFHIPSHPKNVIWNSELCPLCINPQVQTELRRWLRKCRNQNHPTQAKRSITQITSRAREGFGQHPSSANISSVWHLEIMTEWCVTVRDGFERCQRTAASIHSLSAAAKTDSIRGVGKQENIFSHGDDWRNARLEQGAGEAQGHNCQHFDHISVNVER